MRKAAGMGSALSAGFSENLAGQFFTGRQEGSVVVGDAGRMAGAMQPRGPIDLDSREMGSEEGDQVVRRDRLVRELGHVIPEKWVEARGPPDEILQHGQERVSLFVRNRGEHIVRVGGGQIGNEQGGRAVGAELFDGLLEIGEAANGIELAEGLVIAVDARKNFALKEHGEALIEPEMLPVSSGD